MKLLKKRKNNSYLVANFNVNLEKEQCKIKKGKTLFITDVEESDVIVFVNNKRKEELLKLTKDGQPVFTENII